MENFTEKQKDLHIQALCCLGVISSINSLPQPCSEGFATIRSENQIQYAEIMQKLMANILPGDENNATPSPLHDIFENLLNQYSPEKN